MVYIGYNTRSQFTVVHLATFRAYMYRICI